MKGEEEGGKIVLDYMRGEQYGICSNSVFRSINIAMIFIFF